MASIGVEVSPANLGALAKLARGLNNADGVLERAAYRAINKVGAKYATKSKRAISAKVNIAKAYLDARLHFEQAGPGNLSAVISARDRPTRLARFDAVLRTVSAPGAKGDQSRGIPAGKKAAGVYLRVQSSRRYMPSAFLVSLGSNGMGVFTREGPGVGGRPRPWVSSHGVAWHHYGPAVEQMFKMVAADILPELGTELDAAMEKQVRHEISQELKRGR